jgi:hypothetical protein
MIGYPEVKKVYKRAANQWSQRQKSLTPIQI